ncbi:hypothetical protein IKD57_02535 [Candidatus Saccharibacteria bacterium]|nr:hypothetical protein [Candidatus Saccharibacteria bacterium]
MKRKILSVFLMFTMVMAVVSCNGNATATSEDPMLYSVDDTQPVILEEGISEEIAEEGDGLFGCDEDFVKGVAGTCLVRKKKFYSLMNVIPIENSYDYGIGIKQYEKGAVIYWTADDYMFVTSDDFDPIVVDKSDIIRNYNHEELILRPMELQSYSINAYESPGSCTVYYYSDDEQAGMQRIEYFEDKAFEICDVNGNRMESGQNLERDQMYTMKWQDDYGFHELPMDANHRFYHVSGEDIKITGEKKGDYSEYNLSSLSAGTTYVILTSKQSWGRGFITVQ